MYVKEAKYINGQRTMRIKEKRSSLTFSLISKCHIGKFSSSLMVNNNPPTHQTVLPIPTDGHKLLLIAATPPSRSTHLLESLLLGPHCSCLPFILCRPSGGHAPRTSPPQPPHPARVYRLRVEELQGD